MSQAWEVITSGAPRAPCSSSRGRSGARSPPVRGESGITSAAERGPGVRCCVTPGVHAEAPCELGAAARQCSASSACFPDQDRPPDVAPCERVDPQSPFGHIVVTNRSGRVRTGQHQLARKCPWTWTNRHPPGRTRTGQHGRARSSNPASTADRLRKPCSRAIFAAYSAVTNLIKPPFLCDHLPPRDRSVIR